MVDDIKKTSEDKKINPHALKEARVLFKKLEAGNIVPFTNPVSMEKEIHKKVTLAGVGVDVSDLVYKINPKNVEKRAKKSSDVERRIDDAVKRSEMAANGAIQAPYLPAFVRFGKKPSDSPEDLIRKKESNAVKVGDNILSESIFAGFETLNHDTITAVVVGCDILDANASKYCKAANKVAENARKIPAR